MKKKTKRWKDICDCGGGLRVKGKRLAPDAEIKVGSRVAFRSHRRNCPAYLAELPLVAYDPDFAKYV